MCNNLCDHVNEYAQPGLVNRAKNQRNLSEETDQKVEAVAEVEKEKNCSRTN